MSGSRNGNGGRSGGRGRGRDSICGDINSNSSNNGGVRNRRGRGGGGRRGGRGGAADPSVNGYNGVNFAGRGPTNFGDYGLGGENSRGGNPGGPRHFGDAATRPDRITPKLPADEDYEDEETDEENTSSLAPNAPKKDGQPNRIVSANNADQATMLRSRGGSLRHDEQLNHNTPVNNDNADQATSFKNTGSSMSQNTSCCLICYSSKLHLRRTIAPCGHDDICEFPSCVAAAAWGERDTGCAENC